MNSSWQKEKRMILTSFLFYKLAVLFCFLINNNNKRFRIISSILRVFCVCFSYFFFFSFLNKTCWYRLLRKRQSFKNAKKKVTLFGRVNNIYINKLSYVLLRNYYLKCYFSYFSHWYIYIYIESLINYVSCC